MTTESKNHIAERRLIGTLLAEDYARLVGDTRGRHLFSEMVADLLHEAVAKGQDPSSILQRAYRQFARDVAVAGETPPPLAIPTPEKKETPVTHQSQQATFEEPPSSSEPKWEEPTITPTTKRGRFGRFEQTMRENPNRWLVLAENVASTYASTLRKREPDFQFEHKRMRANSPNSYKVWARYVGAPNLKAVSE